MIMIVGGSPELWGLIPSFLDEADPRGAREQFDAKYQSGWRPQKGFKLRRVPNQEMALLYPGDPPLEAISMMLFRNEIIVLFEAEYVAVVQPDESWEACRMD